jgi:iron complex outermembrane receptor protein
VKILLTLSLLFIISLRVFSAEISFGLEGTVIDSSDGQAVELATVVLKNAATNEIITGATTGADGSFTFSNVKAGKYSLVVTFVGYHTKTISVEVTGKTILKPIKLAPENQTLAAATIVAEKSLVVKTAEKTVYNVGNSPINQTGTLEDVLRNMPDVMVDQNDNVSVIGKQGVIVLVDGRPNALATSDLAAFLKSIPASSIEAIEVITNPSAKYDAEGNAGIINIKLKKGKADGFNCNASPGVGILNRYNGNVNINYRKNKINVFANYSLNYSKNKGATTSNRTITSNDSTLHYNAHNQTVYSGFGNNLKAGFDYFIDDNNTITYTLGGNYRKSWSPGSSYTTNLDASEDLLSTDQAISTAVRSNYTISNSINYQKKFDSTERELDVYASYSYVASYNNADLNTVVFDTLGNLVPSAGMEQPTVTNNNAHSAVLQLDYIHPLKRLKGYKIEMGAKDVISINNNYFTDYQVVNNVREVDSLLSNRFNYSENVAALYGILRGAYSKWLTYSAGLRIEDAIIKSNSSSVNQSYLDFFPNASIGFSFGESQHLSFSYSRRLTRPSFWLLNNSITYIDPYNIWQGNPYLKPSYSNVLSMSYNFNVKKQFFSFDANGTIQNGGFFTYYNVDSLHITHQGTENGTTNSSLNLRVYGHIYLTKWWEWQMSHSFNYNYYAYAPGLNTSSFTGANYGFWTNMDFKFWKNTTLEIGSWAVTKQVQVQGTQTSMGVLWASIKKSFLKDQLTASIAAQDILQTLKNSSVITTPGLYAARTWQYYDRCVTFTISYRFGSDQIKERKEKQANERLEEGG